MFAQELHPLTFHNSSLLTFLHKCQHSWFRNQNKKGHIRASRSPWVGKAELCAGILGSAGVLLPPALPHGLSHTPALWLVFLSRAQSRGRENYNFNLIVFLIS